MALIFDGKTLGVWLGSPFASFTLVWKVTLDKNNALYPAQNVLND